MSRYRKPDPTTDYSMSKAETKFAQYLRGFYRLSVQVPMYYEEFEPRKDQIIQKFRQIDIVLDDYELPIELLGPPHRKQRQEIKDERIFKVIERQYGKKPVLIDYDGREPSKKKMWTWHQEIKKRTEE